MATYVNNLRLKEIATGDEDGTWGTSTNTNLELITDGFSYGTLDVAADANETFTMPDATANATRGLYIKFTSTFGSLTATRTLTLGPNTVSKMWFIENATSGSQSIVISQGSGASVTIANGATKVIYTDGTGAGAAVVDALALYTPVTNDTLAEVLALGNTTSGTDVSITSGDSIIGAGDINITGSISCFQLNMDGNIVNVDNTSNKVLSAGTAAGEGANLLMYGGAEATTPFDIRFRLDATNALHYDHSATTWNFQANDIVTTGTAATGSLTVTGNLDFVGTNAYIRKSDENGSLFLTPNASNGTGTDIRMYGRLHGSNPNDILFLENGNPRLHYVASTNTWDFLSFPITTTGTLDSGALTVTTTGVAALFQRDNDGTGGASIEIYANSATPADNDYVGAAFFNGNDSGGNKTTYGAIRGRALDVTDTTEDGAVELFAMQAGTSTNILTLKGTDLSATFAGDVGFSGANPLITGNDTDGSLSLGGYLTNSGANLSLYGPTALLANDINFRVDTTFVLKYDHSATTWDFQANDITTAGDVTLSNGDLTLSAGNLTATGDNVFNDSGGAAGGVVDIITINGDFLGGTTGHNAYSAIKMNLDTNTANDDIKAINIIGATSSAENIVEALYFRLDGGAGAINPEIVNLDVNYTGALSTSRTYFGLKHNVIFDGADTTHFNQKVYGLYSNVENLHLWNTNANSSKTKFYGIYSRVDVPASANMNVYGLYINNIISDASHYGIYQSNGSVKNYFAGDTTFSNDVTLSGGNASITGTLDVSGDTIIGSTSVTPDGTLHVHSGSAGSVTAHTNYDDLVIENSSNAGIHVLSPDANTSGVYFGSPSDSVGAGFVYNYSGLAGVDSAFQLSSYIVGGEVQLRADNAVTNLTLSGASGSELATFAGDVTLSDTLTVSSGSSSKVRVVNTLNNSNSESHFVAENNAGETMAMEISRSGASGVGKLISTNDMRLVPAGITALTLDSSQNATFAGDVTLSEGDISLYSTTTPTLRMGRNDTTINANGLGDIDFESKDNTAGTYAAVARIRAQAVGVHSAGDTPAKLEFSTVTDGTESLDLALTVTSGNATFAGTVSTDGIAFPATQVASADANTLDDYEEGTWTPVPNGTGTLTTDSVAGSYTKVGRLVTVCFEINFAAGASGNGTNISGLPFSVKNQDSDPMGAGRENFNSGDMWQLRGNANAATMNYVNYANSTTIAGDDILIGSLTYEV